MLRSVTASLEKHELACQPVERLLSLECWDMFPALRKGVGMWETAVEVDRFLEPRMMMDVESLSLDQWEACKLPPCQVAVCVRPVVRRAVAERLAGWLGWLDVGMFS